MILVPAQPNRGAGKQGCEQRLAHLAVYCPLLTRLNMGLFFSNAKLTIVRKLLLLDLYPAFFAASVISATLIVLPRKSE